MAVDERRRVELYDRLATAIGQEATDTLMAMLPPSGEEVATKSDIVAVRADMAELRAEFDRRFDAIDSRFDAVDARFDAVDARFDAIDRRFGDVDARSEVLEHKLTGAFERSIREAITMQTKTLVFSQLGSLVVIAALAFGLR